MMDYISATQSVSSKIRKATCKAALLIYHPAPKRLVRDIGSTRASKMGRFKVTERRENH